MRYLTLSPPVIIAGLTCIAALTVGLPSWVRGDARSGVIRGSQVLLAGALVAVLLVTLVGTTTPTGRVSLVPGASILALLENTADPRNAVENVVGNVLLFVPLGFLAVTGLRLRLLPVVGAAALLSALIELTQLAMGNHWVDVDDVILNTAGAGLGALCAQVGSTLLRRRHRSHSA